MVIGFDLADRENIVRQHEQDRRIIIASLTLAAGCDIDTHKLSEGLYCRDDSGKRYLSYKLEADPRAVLSTPPDKLSTVRLRHALRETKGSRTHCSTRRRRRSNIGPIPNMVISMDGAGGPDRDSIQAV